eukprot:1195309-Prorocentrum_minimum.AAC.1
MTPFRPLLPPLLTSPAAHLHALDESALVGLHGAVVQRAVAAEVQRLQARALAHLMALEPTSEQVNQMNKSFKC